MVQSICLYGGMERDHRGRRNAFIVQLFIICDFAAGFNLRTQLAGTR